MPLEKEEEKEDGQIMSLDDSCIERVCDCLSSLSLLPVRVVVLEYSQLHKMPYNLVVCKFGGFEYCVMHNIYRRYDKNASMYNEIA